MPQQIALFKGLRGAEWDDLEPFQGAYFPQEYVVGLEALFRADGHLLATGRLTSDELCPYRVGHELYSRALPDRQLRLFDEEGPAPLARTCDCPRAHGLLKDLGRRLPQCSKNRCPVRVIVTREDS